jgi:predicted lipoprotein
LTHVKVVGRLKRDTVDNQKKGAPMRKLIPVLAVAIALALSGCGKVEHSPPPAATAASADTG